MRDLILQLSKSSIYSTKPQSGEVTLGTPVVITFNNTNSYQELNFKARMESPSKDATPGNVYAQADYKIAYE
ncbi:hypothetical protein M4Z80_04930, partial [Escherichia coli]|nr:hypothetical protein [Escherichia coli]